MRRYRRTQSELRITMRSYDRLITPGDETERRAHNTRGAQCTREHHFCGSFSVFLLFSFAKKTNKRLNVVSIQQNLNFDFVIGREISTEKNVQQKNAESVGRVARNRRRVERERGREGPFQRYLHLNPCAQKCNKLRFEIFAFVLLLLLRRPSSFVSFCFLFWKKQRSVSARCGWSIDSIDSIRWNNYWNPKHQTNTLANGILRVDNCIWFRITSKIGFEMQKGLEWPVEWNACDKQKNTWNWSIENYYYF